MMGKTTETLGDIIHKAMCPEAASYCPRWAKAKGNRHYEYYQKQADIVINRLDPIIGRTNVSMVVKIVLDEIT